MNWIFAGLIMFFCSVAEYLLIRKASASGMPIAVQNLASFLLPLLLYIVLAGASGTPAGVTPYQGLILVTSAVLFSYLGSKWSLNSMKYAPNPGYALVISKSYVVFTTLFALAVFGSPLTVKSAVGILSIVLASALIMIDPVAKRKGESKPVWLLYSVLTFLSWGMLAVSSKYLLDLGVPIYTRLIWITGIVTAIILYDMKRERIRLPSLPPGQLVLFVVFGVLFAGFNYFMQLGYQLAPNIGYINAMNAASMAFVTVGATVFFGDEFNIRKFLGVAGVIAGLLLLVL